MSWSRSRHYPSQSRPDIPPDSTFSRVAPASQVLSPQTSDSISRYLQIHRSRSAAILSPVSLPAPFLSILKLPQQPTRGSREQLSSFLLACSVSVAAFYAGKFWIAFELAILTGGSGGCQSPSAIAAGLASSAFLEKGLSAMGQNGPVSKRGVLYWYHSLIPFFLQSQP